MKRSILSLLYLIQGMQKAGVDLDYKLKKIGLNVDAIDSSAIIHPKLEWDILSVLGENIEPHQGLLIGQHYSLAGYGPLLMLLISSPNIKTALEKGVQYGRLTHLTGELGLNFKDENICLTYKPVNLNSKFGQLLAHCEISGKYRFIQDIYKMMELKIPKAEIYLPFEKPNESFVMEMYQKTYGEHIIFNADIASFNFNKKVLEEEIPSRDKITFKAYEQKCISELERLDSIYESATLIQRVKDYLEIQNGTIPTMSETAKALHVPERTLRHQLQQQKTSYKIIREEIIKNKALRLIEYEEYSIEMIAELLGYSEPAAFNHAFKRWFGQSPRQYK